jgi:hypothetical protein
MSEEEIRKELSNCTNFVQLVMNANKLKSAGEKASTVNRVVMQLKKELLASTGNMKHIDRIDVPNIKEDKIGSIPFAVNSLAKPTIIYDGESILL